MSLNQSRADKSESTQYKRIGRSGSSGQPRNSSGGSGKGGGGGGTAPPPSLSSNRSFKKPNNAQGGQSRVSAASVNLDSNIAPAARTVQNGAHLQHQLYGESDAPVTGVTVKQTDTGAQKSTRAVPKAPSSHTATVNTEPTLPATPTKAPGAVSRLFPLQFGSISPGFMNEMQIPAQTSSAPPNLDEQKRDQARHDSLRAVPTLPIPSATKEQLPMKDAGDIDQPNTGEAHPIPKAKRDIQVSSAAAVTQTQKPSAHPITGISMPMPFNQPQIPVKGMAATSMPLQMPMPLPIGNPQVSQQVFVSGFQHLPLPPQGMMHQGQSLNFSSPMGRQLPPHLWGVGMNITPQCSQQQTGKFGGPCSKPITIRHPDTHEELRLDKRADMHIESGSSGPRSHPNIPHQSQPIPPFPPAHHMNYYSNSYDPSSLFLPLTSTQITPGSQPPRFNYPVSRGPQTGSFTTSDLYMAYKGLEEKKGTVLSSEITSTKNLKQAGARGKKKRKEILQKADAAGATSDLYMAYKGPEENKGTVLFSEITSTNNLKQAGARRKKKRKEILQKADAAGTTSDLYMAYKGPEEKKEIVLSSDFTSTNNLKQVPDDSSKDDAVSSEISGQSKAEPDDWEDAADIFTPKLETLDNVKQVSGGLKHHGEDGNGVAAKKYSRDFLLKFSEQCTDLPEGFDTYKGPEEKKGTVLSSEITSANNLKLAGARGKKKRKEILQKAGAAGTTSDLYMAYKDPEEKKGTVLSSEITSTNNLKQAGARGKKKRKEILQKADAAGTSSDLYMAYKGPEEKKGTVLSSEISSTNNLKQVPDDSSKEDAVSSEISGQSKAEPNDWEDDADISTPKLETLDNVKQVSGGLKHHGEDGNGIAAKKYSDFLLKFSEQCTDIPEGFDTSDIVEALMISNVTLSSESYPSPGRVNDRSTGGSRPDGHGRGTGDEERWSKPLTPGGQTPVPYAGGILSGLMHSPGSQGGMQRNSPDSDRWQHATAFQKGLLPSPQPCWNLLRKSSKWLQNCDTMRQNQTPNTNKRVVDLDMNEPGDFYETVPSTSGSIPTNSSTQSTPAVSTSGSVNLGDDDSLAIDEGSRDTSRPIGRKAAKKGRKSKDKVHLFLTSFQEFAEQNKLMDNLALESRTLKMKSKFDLGMEQEQTRRLELELQKEMKLKELEAQNEIKKMEKNKLRRWRLSKFFGKDK